MFFDFDLNLRLAVLEWPFLAVFSAMNFVCKSEPQLYSKCQNKDFSISSRSKFLGYRCDCSGERERKRCKNRLEKLKDCHLLKILLYWYSALKFTVSWIFWLLNNHRTYWIYINFIESKKFFYIQEDQTRHSPTGGRSYKRSWNKMP